MSRTLAGGFQVDAPGYVDALPNPDRSKSSSDQVAAFMAKNQVHYCQWLAARITAVQCALNRKKALYYCGKCTTPMNLTDSDRRELKRRTTKARATGQWGRNHPQLGYESEDEKAYLAGAPMPGIATKSTSSTESTESTNKRGEKKMPKKGTCIGCGRGNVQLIAKDRCWKCYDAVRKGNAASSASPPPCRPHARSRSRP